MSYKPVKVEITPSMLERVRSKSDVVYEGSFMNGKGNTCGYLGKLLVESLRPDWNYSDCVDYDFLTMAGTRIAVKTKTQGVPSTPKMSYEASVDIKSLHQKLDYYMFCRVYHDKSNDTYPFGWVVGGISRSNFMEWSRKLKKGDPDGSNGWKVAQDCRNIGYDQLLPIRRKDV